MGSQAELLVLFDNGSLRPASTLHLRDMAAAISEALGKAVMATSVLHSDKVDTTALFGKPAALLEDAVRDFWRQNPDGEALLVPAFFGPSRAVTHHVPAQMRELARTYPNARWRMAPCLVELRGNRGEGDESDEGGKKVACALADEARRVATENRFAASKTKIVVVDHGSPERAVTDVREYLGAQVRAIFGESAGEGEAAARIGTASMERRPLEKYAFNEPLLARALRTPPFDEGDVIIALQFLSPGRHAGPSGDVAAICDAAVADAASHGRTLRTWMTAPIGMSPHVLAVLRKRFEDLLLLEK